VKLFKKSLNLHTLKYLTKIKATDMKSYLKFRNICTVCILGFLATSCISNVEEQQEELINADAKVSYTNDVKPIMDARCLSCHGAGGNFPELKNYTEVSTHAVSVKDEVASGRMPRGAALTAAQVKSIVDWVNEGALDN
jgi:mono/diheme cytochrome c family protein